MFSLYYTAVTIDETFVHILSRNSYLTARLYWERRAVALLEVDLWWINIVINIAMTTILVDGDENDFDL